jgi:hypothetical protein
MAIEIPDDLVQFVVVPRMYGSGETLGGYLLDMNRADLLQVKPEQWLGAELEHVAETALWLV